MIPYGSSTVSTKLASVTLAAASCLVLPLAGVHVEPVCVGVDVDAMLPVTEEVPVLFPLELAVWLRNDMTVSHSHVVYSGLLAKTWQSGRGAAKAQRVRDCDGNDEDGDNELEGRRDFEDSVRAEELLVGCM